MGTIVGFKEVTVNSDDGTSEGCISITSKSYKCIDISAYVPTCIVITNFTPDEFTVPIPTLSGLEDEVSQYSEQFVTITNYDSQYSYDIRLSLNGGKLNITGAGTFTWTMPGFQNPLFYDNDHTLSVYAHKDGEYSLGAHYTSNIKQPEEINLSFKGKRDYISFDGKWTEFYLNVYGIEDDFLIFNFRNDRNIDSGAYCVAQILGEDDEVLQTFYPTYADDSGNCKILPPFNEIRGVRVAAVPVPDVYNKPEANWFISVSDIAITPLELVPTLPLNELTSALASSINYGESQTYDFFNYYDTMEYNVYTNVPQILSCSTAGGSFVITNISYLTNDKDVKLYVRFTLPDMTRYSKSFYIGSIIVKKP